LLKADGCEFLINSNNVLECIKYRILFVCNSIFDGFFLPCFWVQNVFSDSNCFILQLHEYDCTKNDQLQKKSSNNC